MLTEGATGENPIVCTSPKADVIMGPFAIVMADAMMGEPTPKMAQPISSSQALKILLPLTHGNVRVVGVSGEPLPHLVDQAIEVIKEMYLPL